MSYCVPATPTYCTPAYTPTCAPTTQPAYCAPPQPAYCAPAPAQPSGAYGFGTAGPAPVWGCQPTYPSW